MLLFSEAFRLFLYSFIVLIINCLHSFQAGLGGHMLGIADEDGWVQILDSRRTGSRSLLKGSCKRRHYYTLLHSLTFLLG